MNTNAWPASQPRLSQMPDLTRKPGLVFQCLTQKQLDDYKRHFVFMGRPELCDQLEIGGYVEHAADVIGIVIDCRRPDLSAMRVFKPGDPEAAARVRKVAA